jgi:hypothetical protein
MKKQLIISFTVAALFITLIFGFWVYYKINSFKENEEKTTKLSQKIKNLFENRNDITDYPYQQTNTNWKKNYLVLENFHTNNLNVAYNKDWNEKMQTEQNFPGNNIKGLVILENYNVDFGKYENSHKTATQQNYILNYFEIKSKTIVAKDTIYGEEPPQSIGASGAGIGNLPEDEKVIEAINKRIK